MDLIKEFERHMVDSGFAHATIESYVGDLRLFHDYLTSKRMQVELTRQSILQYKEHMRNERYAVATFNKKVNSLASYNQFLIERGAVKDVVVTLKKDRIKVAAGSAPEVEVFTEEEIGVILTRAADVTECSLRNRTIVHLLLYTGLRVSELCSLRMADVDRIDATLRVIGKGGKYREVPLRPDLVDLLSLYVATERKESPFAESDYLLVSQRAAKMHRDAVRRMLGELGKSIGVEIHPHKFRHTFASRLIEKGVPLTTVSKLCGHAGIDTTARFYVSTGRQQKMDAVNLL